MSNGQRWNYKQFRRWVEAMDYRRAEIIDKRTVIPYDIDLVAADLSLSAKRIRVYWSGIDHGVAIYVPPYITRSCVSLLAIKRGKDLLLDTKSRRPDLADVIDPVLEALAS